MTSPSKVGAPRRYKKQKYKAPCETGKNVYRDRHSATVAGRLKEATYGHKYTVYRCTAGIPNPCGQYHLTSRRAQ